MALGQIRYAKHDGLCFIRLSGDVRYTSGSLRTMTESLDLLLVQLFSAKDFSEIVIDMSATEAIDSTNMSMLARIAVHARQAIGSTPTIVCGEAHILQSLDTMGCDRVFDLVRAPAGETPDETALKGVVSSERERVEALVAAYNKFLAMTTHGEDPFDDICSVAKI